MEGLLGNAHELLLLTTRRNFPSVEFIPMQHHSIPGRKRAAPRKNLGGVFHSFRFKNRWGNTRPSPAHPLLLLLFPLSKARNGEKERPRLVWREKEEEKSVSQVHPPRLLTAKNTIYKEAHSHFANSTAANGSCFSKKRMQYCDAAISRYVWRKRRKICGETFGGMIVAPRRLKSRPPLPLFPTSPSLFLSVRIPWPPVSPSCLMYHTYCTPLQRTHASRTWERNSNAPVFDELVRVFWALCNVSIIPFRHNKMNTYA